MTDAQNPPTEDLFRRNSESPWEAAWSIGESVSCFSTTMVKTNGKRLAGVKGPLSAPRVLLEQERLHERLPAWQRIPVELEEMR